MLNIGPQELLIVLIIALIVVGPQRLPDLSRQIGKGLREFRKVQDEVKGIAKLDLDQPKAGPRRAPASPTAPAVHRTPRPAPSPTPVTPTAEAPDATDAGTAEPGSNGPSPGQTAG
jgi:sec-independent protein translocase protein TatB